MKTLFTIIVSLALLSSKAYGQTYAVAPDFDQQFLDVNARPVSNGKLCSYAAGTTTPLAAFSDSSGTQHTNPIILTSAGRLPSGALFLSANSYKLVLRRVGTDGTGVDATCPGTIGAGAEIGSWDNVSNLALLFTLSFATRLDDKVCHASQYPGATEDAKITACLAVIPSTGGTIDGRGLEGSQSWAACPFTGVTKPVVLLKGMGTTTLSVDCTVPSSVTLKFDQGAILSINSSKTLTVNGDIQADVSTHFSGSGSLVLTHSRIDAAYPQWFGAKADGVILGGISPTGSCTGSASSTSLTCSGSAFTSADIGKSFDLAHAGTANCHDQYYNIAGVKMNCNLVGTISAVGGSTTLTLSAPLISAVTNEQFAYGTADQAAIQKAIDSGAGTVQFTSGIYIITAEVRAAFVGRTLRGLGMDVSRLLMLNALSGGTSVFASIVVENGTNGLTIQNLGFIGTNRLGEATDFGYSYEGLFLCPGIPSTSGCNASEGVFNVHIDHSEFSYFWGHGAYGANGPTTTARGIRHISAVSSKFNYSSNDGWNISPNADETLTASEFIGNGTGGAEISSYGPVQITGNQFTLNKSAGMALGGFNGYSENAQGSTFQVTGNDISYNGNAYPTFAQGSGITITEFGQGIAISGNTIHHNTSQGIACGGNGTRDIAITGNTLYSNGLSNASGGSSFGFEIEIACDDVLVSGNYINDPATNNINTVSRTANVVTVTTYAAHNYKTGYSVVISGVTDAAFNGTFTITATSYKTFTYAQVAGNATSTAGLAYSGSSGYTSAFGILLFSNDGDRVTNNSVVNMHTRNYHVEGLPTHSYLKAEYSYTNPDNVNIVGGTAALGLTALVLDLPPAYTTNAGCTTAAAAAATCDITVTPSLRDTAGGKINTVCTIVAPTGKPVIVKRVQANLNADTITIGTLDGNAAGAGTLSCQSNFIYP